MRTNVLNDLSNVVKKGTGLACSWSQVGRMSGEGAIEHPLSTHSAPFGTRWKPADEKGSTRVWKYVAMIFAVLVMSMANVGMAWGTDFDITVDQIRTLPTRAGFVKLTDGSNCTTNSGKLQVANNKTGTFTIESTVPSVYKIKSIAFTLSRNRTSSQFTCTDGGSITGSNTSHTFTPTSSTPVGSASFSLDNSSAGGGTNITFVVTMTTEETVTVETLHTFSLADGVYSFTSSAGTTKINLTDVGTDAGTVSSSMIQFGKSSSKSYGLNVAAKSGYDLSFVSIYYYDFPQDPKVSADVSTYTKASYTWIPSSTATNVTLTFDTENVKAINIYRIYVGYVAVTKDYTVTAATSTGTDTYGTVEADASSLDEGETTTITATPATGYQVSNWAVSGTGASISPSGDSHDNTTTLTMGTANATVTVTFEKVYASGTYNFVNQGDGDVTWGSSHTVTLPAGTKTTVPAGSRVDNIFFSTALDIDYENGAEAGTGYKGWKIKQSGKLAFYVENDCDVIVTNGIINGMKIHYYNQSNVETNTNLTSTAGTREETAHVKGGTLFEIVSTTTSTNTLKGIRVSYSCTAPTAVYVTQTAGSADMIAGESFTLSAATSEGVEDGATYQWYRGSTEVGSDSPTFTVNSCTATDAGTYWCKITNPCGESTTNSTGYGIKVWQVLLYKDSWNAYNLTSTGTKTGEVTRQLTPGTYYIKLTHNNGVDFGVNTGETISEITATTPSAWTLYNGQNNIKLTVTTAGDYTFGVDYTSADYPKLSVTYPPATISSCDKIYFCPTQNNIATGSAKFSIYFFNDTESEWANCYLVDGTEYADDAKYVAFAPSTTNGWKKMIVVRDDAYASSFSGIWNQSHDITYNGYNYIVGTGWSEGKFTTNLNSFYSSTTPAMSAASYATTVDGTTNASTNLTGATISYASDDPSVATVNSSGVITGVAAGETTITASVGSCTVGSATITVSKNTPTAYTVSGTTTICSGSTATITLSGSEDGASYQLKKGGVAEGGAKAGTGNSLTWTVSAAGTYTVSAVETAKYLGGDMTDDAVITVNTPVTISWNNAPANGTIGGSMTASVTTNYAAGVTYAVTSASPAGCVTIHETSGAISYVAAGTATITATVTGAGNYCSSANVTQSVTVNKKTPTKYDFSMNKTVLCGEETATLTLEDSEDGVTYELREDSSHPIADTEKSGTGSALTWTGLGAGTYVVYAVETATYSERQMNSSKITVTTGTTTSITTQPTNQEVTVGEEATLTVVAAGTSLSYQWKESATESGEYSNVASGGTSSSYSVTPAAAGTKWYKCVVTGTCGTETTAARKIVANAAADPLVSWTMNVNNATWGAASTSNHGNTEISSIATSCDAGGEKASTSVTAKVLMAEAEVTTSAAPSKSANFTFTLASGNKIVPEKITCQVFNVSGGQRTYKAQISDNNEHVYNSTNTLAVSTEATLTPATFNFASDLELKGNITLKIYAWDTDDSKDPTEFRMGPEIKFYGEIETACGAHGLAYGTASVAKNVGDAAFTNTLTNPNSLTVTYSSSNTSAATVNATSGMVTIEGAGVTTITATWAGNATYCAGTATYTLTVSSGCTPQSLSKVSATKGTSGTVTGYNDKQYAGDAVVKLYDSSPQSASLPGVGTVDGYKMGDAGSSIVFATLKGTSFQAGDKVRIGITKKNDTRTVDASKDILTIYYGTSKTDATALHTITGVTGAGFYEYTLTLADVTAIGSKKGIGLFRESDNGENPYVYSVEIIGCREWAVCTAPDAIAVGSVTGEGATFTITDALNTNNYEIYYSTSSTAPTAETSATVSGISTKSRAVTGLTAVTTYYYWVRSNCGGATKSSWVAGTPVSFTTSAAAATHSVTYNGNGSTGGSVPTDDTAYEEGDVVTVKGNTGSLVKTGQTFLGWSTSATASSGTFYPAGYKFYMPNAAVTLYAVWGSTGATCVTLTDFETGSHDKSSGKPDSEGKYFYGYKGTKSATYAVTITTPGTGTVGVNGGDNLQMAQNTRFNIYADNTTTSGTPATFSNITSISFKIKAVKNTRIPTIDVYVGSTKVRTVIGGSESSGTDGHEYDTSDFTTISVTGIASLSGIVKFVNTSSGSSDFKAYFDDIQICYGSGASSGYTVSFDMQDHGSQVADIANVPSGSKIGAPIPTPTAVGVEFGGWYEEAGCSNEWDFASDVVNADKTLYAKWTTCAPSISAHPVAATYTQGAAATALSVTASGEGLNYQWYTSETNETIEGSSAIPSATSASYTPSTTLLGTIYYFCVVSNTCGNAVSNFAGITVNDSKPAPKANWTVEEPKEGGKGFTFSIEVNKNDGTTNWDGELIASMLTLSDNAILDASSIVVDNTNKTISGTYGVKAGSSSPVTFYLLLPATDTQSATRLDHDRTFTPCAGGGAGDNYNVRVRKDYEKDASNNYRWVTLGAGEITYAVSSSISSVKAASTVASVFDSIMPNDKQYVWVKTYEANTKTIRLHVETSGANVSVNTLYKNTVYATAADKDIVSSDDYSVNYDGSGSAENTGAKGTHYIDITFDSPLEANDIICVKFSSSKVKAYGAVLTTIGDGGSETTALSWSNDQASGATLVKREDAADFTITANRNNAAATASLGAISYTSSNTSIATVNASTGQVHIADNIDFGSDEFKTTTITATLAASGCYKKAVITYILKVTKYVCEDAPGTITYVDHGCSMDLTLEGYEEGATIQWYKGGSPVGTNSATYNATEPGEYYAVSHKNCDITSTNSIKLERASATAEKIVNSWYVKNGRRTPDIALVHTTGATSFTVTSGGTITEIGGCTFELKDDGIIYLHGQKEDGSAPSDMTDGDMTITITVSGCSGALSGLNITIHKQAETAKPTVAFVVDGTLRKDGGTATSVSTAKTSDRPLWKYLENTFTLTGCNAYWSVDSKELRQYYSQFDAILITDDPSTDTKGTGGVSYVKAFGTMVDVRPVLTMEAFVGKFKDGGWHVYDATPTSPNPRQVEMKLECKNHDIFRGLDPETSDNVRTTTDEHGNEYWHVIMVDTTVAPYHNTSKDYKDLPALQGFDKKKFSNMLGVGTIAEETLQGGVERQEEPAARMMILGIQNEAMAALTNEGKLIVKNAIEYLLKTNMEDVNDCSNYFTGGPSGTGDDWANPENWSGGKVPDFETRVRILRPVVISDDTKAIVARVDIATRGKSKWVDGECNGKVTVNSQGALIVGGKIRRAEAPHFGVDDLEPTENDDLIVKAATDTHKQGALIFDNSDGDTHAVVEMWNPSYWVVDGGTGKKTKYWSYVAVPIQEADIPNFFWYGFTYLYDETSGWIKKSDGTSLYPFQGIGASLQTGHMETFYGPLATTESQDITLTYTGGVGQGMNLIGNSWTAPIQIANFEEDDFGDAAAEVWVFNTGHTNDGHSTMADGSAGTTSAGQWQTIPIGVAGLPGYTGLKVIPAMQAFEVNTTSKTTLHLDYDRLVRAGRENLNEPMRAPRRGSAAKQIEATMRVRVSGEVTHTDVYLLKDARFSDGFDNGWDGHYLSGDDRSAQLYAISEAEGELAFLAQPEIEGTVLGFAPSRYGNDYTFTFYYLGEEEYYLNDIKLQKSTLISEDESYMFTFEEGDTNRFYISKTPINAPSVATGTENTGDGVKARKVLVNDKLYIILNGRVYSAEGVMVK